MTSAVVRLRLITLALASIVGFVRSPAFAAEPQQPPSPTEAAAPASSSPQSGPDSQLDQIKNAINRAPALKLDDDQLRFYVQVVAKQPQFGDYIKGYDFINGPTKRGNPMSHKEFLSMVTPKELHSSAGITATELLQGAITNWLGQKLLARALEDIKHARDEHEAQEIRDRIDRELAALNVSPRN